MSDENTPEIPATFRDDLSRIINHHSIDAKLNVPDFILASFIENVLVDFNFANSATRRWEGK